MVAEFEFRNGFFFFAKWDAGGSEFSVTSSLAGDLVQMNENMNKLNDIIHVKIESNQFGFDMNIIDTPGLEQDDHQRVKKKKTYLTVLTSCL